MDCNEIDLVGNGADGSTCQLRDSLDVSAICDVDADAIDPDASIVRSQDTQLRKRGGRSASPLWSLFTDDPNPQMQRSFTCKHCKIIILHHKKSEYAERKFY